jgi:4-amino-4-deoxy-L-arabinose transferase-like glycosyltransferase
MVTAVPRPAGWGLLALVVVAFAVRLGAVAATGGLSAPPTGDAAEFDAYAWNLVQGRGYSGPSPDVVDGSGRAVHHPTAYRPPVSPLVYAAAYAVAGHSYPAAHAANAAVGAVTVLLVFGIADRVYGRAAGWLAAGAFAVYPPAAHHNLQLLSEAHAAFLVCLFVWLCLRVPGPRGGWWAAAAGVAFGLLLLCKPGYLLLVPLLPAWAWTVGRWDRRAWARAALIPVVGGLAVVPWAARNYREVGAAIPFGTTSGSLLLQSNNRLVVLDPRYHGMGVWDTHLPEYAASIRAPNDEVARDAVARRHAVAWLRENPGWWFYLAWGKAQRMWWPVRYGAGSAAAEAALNALYAAVLAGFAVGVVPATARFVRDRDPAVMIPLLVVATVGMVVLFYGLQRYRYPVEPLMGVVAAGTAVRAAGWARAGFPRPAVTARGVLIAALAAAAAAGLAWACRADAARARAYRAAVARDRVRAIEEAVVRYRDRTGRLPARLEDLIPADLPNAEALHCPTHSLDYADFRWLGSTDPDDAAEVSSYALEPAAGPGPGFRVVQTRGAPPAP